MAKAPLWSAARAALLLQQNPTLTPDQVKARLMKTASKNFPMNSIATDPATGITYTSQYDIFTVGAGYLDVWAALNNQDVLTGTALSPTAIYDPTTKTVSLTSTPWGTSILWGDSIVWGDSVFVQGGSILWGDSVVWGDSTNRSFSILWGDSILWGEGTLSSDTSNVSITGEP